MNKQIKMTTVPKLRFPEFRDAGEWQIEPFENVFTRVTTKNTEKNKNVLTISAQHGLISQLEFFNKTVAAVDVSGYYLLHQYDFVYNKSYSQGYPMGAIKPLKAYEKGIVSTLYICFRINHGYVHSYFEQYFDSGALNGEIEKIAKEGGRNHGLLNVSVKEFFTKITLPIPPFDEQLKIAGCLSSIDDLITAQTQKVENLKAHKKGLVQKLFPADGEAAPELRFPAFRDAGRWKEDSIGNVCKTFSGGTPSTSHKEFYGGNIPFIRSAEIDKEYTELFLTTEGLENSAAKLVKKGDVLFALYGANSGEVALSKQEGAINQAVLCLKFEGSNAFVYQFLSFKKNWIINKYIQGGQGNLSGEIVKSIRILFPDPEEQKKIADCLSSIDDLISTQNQKLDALKVHKKGLMQQFFPNPGEMNP
jgi:type I restriction enzyme S subunit